MATPKENINEKVWIALGMIQPEWIYMNHFLAEKELEEEPILSAPPSTGGMRIRIRARNE